MLAPEISRLLLVDEVLLERLAWEGVLRAAEKLATGIGPWEVRLGIWTRVVGLRAGRRYVPTWPWYTRPHRSGSSSILGRLMTAGKLDGETGRSRWNLYESQRPGRGGLWSVAPSRTALRGKTGTHEKGVLSPNEDKAEVSRQHFSY